MIPYTVIFLVLVLIFIIIGYFSNKNNRIQKLLNKKTSYSLDFTTELNKKDFENALYNLAKNFKYNVEYVRTENNQYILSDRISFKTCGFYYLFEYNNYKINVYLIPRYFMELDRFGLFNNRLEKISALILLSK